MMSRHHGLVATSTLVLCSLQLLLLMSRHRFSCRNISSWYCILERVSPDVVTSRCCRDIGPSLLHPSTGCCDVATLVFPSRHSSFNFCSFLSCLCSDPCRDLHQIPFNLPDVATSELNCVDLETASMTQLVEFISALPIDCTFIHLLLHFSSFFLSSC